MTEYVIVRRRGLAAPSYYRGWTGIGPMFTNDPEAAYRFASHKKALFESAQHFAFVGYEVRPVPSQEAASP